MNQILRCDWLYGSRLPAVSRKRKLPRKPYNKSFIDQGCSVKMAELILASFFFREFMDLNSVSVHKHAKQVLDQYPAILTLRLANNSYISWMNFEHYIFIYLVGLAGVIATKILAKLRT